MTRKRAPHSRWLRLGVNLIDQGVASLISIGMMMAAAQTLGPGPLGEFSIGIATVQPMIAVIRALSGEVMLVEAAGSNARGSRPRVRQGVSRALGVSVALGFVGSALAVAGSFVWADMASVLRACAMVVPAVVVQDGMRHVLLTERRAFSLLFNDLSVLVLTILGIFIVGATSAVPAYMLLAWGASCCIVGGLSWITLGPSIQFRDSARWLRRTWGLSSSFAFESVLGAVVGYTIVVVLASVSGPAEVAAYRSCVSVLGLTSLVINFLRTAFLREISPDQVAHPSGVGRLLLQMGLLVGVSCGAAGILVLVLPPDVGHRLLGDTWVLIGVLVIPGSIQRFFAGLSIAPLIVLRVQRIGWRGTGIRLTCLAGGLLLVPYASSIYGATGALLAESVLYFAITVGLTVLAFRESLRRRGLGSVSTLDEMKSGLRRS